MDDFTVLYPQRVVVVADPPGALLVQLLFFEETKDQASGEKNEARLLPIPLQKETFPGSSCTIRQKSGVKALHEGIDEGSQP